MLSNKTQNNAVYDSFFLEQTFNSPQMQAHSKKEVEWLTSKINLPKTATILDVACGSGRHLKAFVELGYRPHGLDTSPDCIRQAHANCAQIKDQIIEVDFLSYASESTNEFELVFIAGASFGYDSSLTVVLEHLQSLLSLVASNGYLVIQFLNKNWASFTVKNKITFWNESEEYYTLDKRTLTGDLLKSDKIFIKKDDAFQKKYSDVVHTFTRTELETHSKEISAKLKRSFSVVTLSDSFSDIQFSETGSATPVVILRRLL